MGRSVILFHLKELDLFEQLTENWRASCVWRLFVSEVRGRRDREKKCNLSGDAIPFVCDNRRFLTRGTREAFIYKYPASLLFWRSVSGLKFKMQINGITAGSSFVSI